MDFAEYERLVVPLLDQQEWLVEQMNEQPAGTAEFMARQRSLAEVRAALDKLDRQLAHDQPGRPAKKAATARSVTQVTWQERHDQLIKEWFEGELKLLDDLYPDPPEPPGTPVKAKTAAPIRRVVEALGELPLPVAVLQALLALAAIFCLFMAVLEGLGVA